MKRRRRHGWDAPPAELWGPEHARRGDMLLVRHRSLLGALIRAFERLRRPRGVSLSAWRACCEYNHVAWVVNTTSVVQEGKRGAEPFSLSALLRSAEKVRVVRWCAESGQTEAAIRFMLWTVGTDYGWLQIAADAFNALSGLELTLGFGVSMVCSTGCCRAAERLGLIPDRSPAAVTPAHLALYAGVR